MILNGEEFVDSNTRKWKITSINIPVMNKKDVLAELRKAVVAHGYTGLPDIAGKHMAGKAVADF